MKTAVMYGAGNIGRGFIAQVFFKSGYKVTFIDVAKETVNELNNRGSYPIKVVSQEGQYEEIIENVNAIDGTDIELAAEAIAKCDLMATAVGANILKRIAPVVAKGVMARNKRPLDIIICENLMDAGKVFRGMVEEDAGQTLDWVGFVETSIGRMVPVMTPKMQEGDILKVWVEPYCLLPLDSEAFVGQMPNLLNAVPFSPFRFYEERKLYIHNLGHASCAYLGFLKGYEFIWQAVEDEEIYNTAFAAMNASAIALNCAYGVDIENLKEHIADLLNRFKNKALGDTVLRVGKDPMRKLAPKDRFSGAIERCKAEGVNYDALLMPMAAALCFKEETDPTASVMQDKIQALGALGFLQDYCKLNYQDSQVCAKFYEKLQGE